MMFLIFQILTFSVLKFMFESFNCYYFSAKHSLFMHEDHILDYGLEYIFKSCFKIFVCKFQYLYYLGVSTDFFFLSSGSHFTTSYAGHYKWHIEMSLNYVIFL